jgi:hypothetical protein
MKAAARMAIRRMLFAVRVEKLTENSLKIGLNLQTNWRPYWNPNSVQSNPTKWLFRESSFYSKQALGQVKTQKYIRQLLWAPSVSG